MVGWINVNLLVTVEPIYSGYLNLPNHRFCTFPRNNGSYIQRLIKCNICMHFFFGNYKFYHSFLSELMICLYIVIEMCITAGLPPTAGPVDYRTTVF